MTVRQDAPIPLMVLNARASGVDHYLAHVWPHLAGFSRPEFLAYRDQRFDRVMRENVAPIHERLDPAKAENLDEVAALIGARGTRVVVLQVATDVCRHLGFFTRLLDRLRAMGIAVVGTVHNVLPHDVFPVDRADLSALYDRFHAFVVGNERQRELLVRDLGFASRPVALAPQGAYHLLDAGRYDQAGARRFLDLPEKGPGILFFGNLRPNKGLDLLLDAIPTVRARRPDAWAYVSVSTRLLEPEDREAAERRLAGIPQGEGVHLRCAHLPAHWIEPTFRACNVVALPYRSVSQSGVLNVARAFGRRVVASEVCRGIQPLPPTAGRVVACQDPNALAEGLLAELDAPAPEPLRDDPRWAENAEALRWACEAALAACVRPRGRERYGLAR